MEVSIEANEVYPVISDNGLAFNEMGGRPIGFTLYGSEGDIYALLADVADAYGWELTHRDPGPIEDFLRGIPVPDTSPTMDAAREAFGL